MNKQTIVVSSDPDVGLRTYRNHSGNHANFRISKEGNCFMAMYGENLQVGLATFGDTPEEAEASFRKKYEQS